MQYFRALNVLLSQPPVWAFCAGGGAGRGPLWRQTRLSHYLSRSSLGPVPPVSARPAKRSVHTFSARLSHLQGAPLQWHAAAGQNPLGRIGGNSGTNDTNMRNKTLASFTLHGQNDEKTGQCQGLSIIRYNNPVLGSTEFLYQFTTLHTWGDF